MAWNNKQLPYVIAAKKRWKSNMADWKSIPGFERACQELETRIVAITEELTKDIVDNDEQKRLRLGYRAKLIEILFKEVDIIVQNPIDLPDNKHIKCECCGLYDADTDQLMCISCFSRAKDGK